jgi:hypothetical protein
MSKMILVEKSTAVTTNIWRITETGNFFWHPIDRDCEPADSGTRTDIIPFGFSSHRISVNQTILHFEHFVLLFVVKNIHMYLISVYLSNLVNF